MDEKIRNEQVVGSSPIASSSDFKASEDSRELFCCPKSGFCALFAPYATPNRFQALQTMTKNHAVVIIGQHDFFTKITGYSRMPLEYQEQGVKLCRSSAGTHPSCWLPDGQQIAELHRIYLPLYEYQHVLAGSLHSSRECPAQ